MSTTCAPTLDTVYRTADGPVTLCPTCGAVVSAVCPVTGRRPLAGSLAPVRGHEVRVPRSFTAPAMTAEELDAAFTEILGAAS